MRVVVTAGPTYEPLDSVRRLTNFSTGRLGVDLARFLASKGAEVLLLLGDQAVTPAPEPGHGIAVERFATTADLCDRLASCASGRMDAVFHAAAVSDYRFGSLQHRLPDGTLVPATGGKIPTRAGTLVAELVPTPKVIARLREWFPHAWIAGWKYEVEGRREDVIARAVEQIHANGTQGCVANGPGFGPGFGLVLGDGTTTDFPTRERLFEGLMRQAAAAGGPVSGPS